MVKEKMKKPFYKKWWFIAIIAFIVLGAIFSPSEEEQKQAEKENTEQQTATKPKVEKKEKEPINIKIDVNEELNFSKFDAKITKVKVHEKKDKLLAKIEVYWKNKAYDYGDTMSLFVATQFDVKQGEMSLKEIDDAWNPENKDSSDVFFPNAAGGRTYVTITYELNDETTPIEIIFTPTTETEGSETVTVDLKK